MSKILQLFGGERRSNPVMWSTWKITLYSQLILISVFNKIGCTTMAHLDLLLSQT